MYPASDHQRKKVRQIAARNGSRDPKAEASTGRSNVAAVRSNPGLYLEAFSSPAGNKDDTTVPKAALGGRYQRERDSTCCTQPHRVDYPQA